MSKLTVALIEASHWHVPLYLDAIEKGARVVAVSDMENFAGEKIAKRFGAKLYTDYRELIEKESFDFAFAFGRHALMPDIGQRLLDQGIPFALEKPCGLNSKGVSGLREAAEKKNVYVAVPYIYRVSDLYRAIGNFSGTKSNGYNHLTFRFLAGPPSRYPKAGSAWMLDKSLSGGGCAMNLSGHFVDLLHLLTGTSVRAVSAVMSDRTYKSGIEDYASITLQCANGAVGVIETAYTFPVGSDEQREVNFTISSTAVYIRSAGDGILVRERDSAKQRKVEVEFETDRYYASFVDSVLKEFRSGQRSVAGLPEAQTVMAIMDAAYRSAQAGGAVQQLS